VDRHIVALRSQHRGRLEAAPIGFGRFGRLGRCTSFRCRRFSGMATKATKATEARLHPRPAASNRASALSAGQRSGSGSPFQLIGLTSRHSSGSGVNQVSRLSRLVPCLQPPRALHPPCSSSRRCIVPRRHTGGHAVQLGRFRELARYLPVKVFCAVAAPILPQVAARWPGLPGRFDRSAAAGQWCIAIN
jgi:hypothetical protein